MHSFQGWNSVHPSLSAGGGGDWTSCQIFRKGGLDKALIFRGGLARKRGLVLLKEGWYPNAHYGWLRKKLWNRLLWLILKIFLNFQYLNLLQYPGPNVDLLCICQSDTAPFCENYAKLYFDVKHLEKGLNRGWWNFWWWLFQKKCPFWPVSDTALIF